MKNFCLPLFPNNGQLCLSVGCWPERFGEEIAGHEQVRSRWVPHGAVGFVCCMLVFPERVTLLPFPAAATRPFGVSIGVTEVAWCSVVGCAPCDDRELQILLGLHWIIEWFALEGTFKCHLPRPPCSEQWAAKLGSSEHLPNWPWMFPGIRLPTVSPRALHAGNGAVLALGRKVCIPALQTPACITGMG